MSSNKVGLPLSQLRIRQLLNLSMTESSLTRLMPNGYTTISDKRIEILLHVIMMMMLLHITRSLIFLHTSLLSMYYLQSCSVFVFQPWL